MINVKTGAGIVTCFDCIYSKYMSPLPGDMDCNLVCEINRSNKKWLIHWPIFRALFCKYYITYKMLQDNCFRHCKKHGTPNCPTSIKCLALPNRPYFEQKEK